MFSILLSALLPLFAQAGASGVTFTQEEIQQSIDNSRLIAETAAACLQRTWDEHREFYKENGYSRFYGSRREDYKTVEGRRSAILRILPKLAKRVRKGEDDAIAELKRRVAELTTTSCVGLATKCTGEGFRAARMDTTWKKITTWMGRTGDDGVPLYYGTDLQKALIDLGWKALYWNPDVSQNSYWDAIERQNIIPKDGKEWHSLWGSHADRWNSVLRRRTYYNIPIHDIQTLVNFGISPNRDFALAPFFVGTAHAGYHVFPGFSGQVIEAHSMRDLSSKSNMEVGPFNPLNQSGAGIEGGDGAPRWTRSEHYRSGVIVVPPGFIPEKSYTVPPPALDAPGSGRTWEQPRRKKKKCFWIFCGDRDRDE